MNILGRLAFLFVVVPILELALLIRLGQVVGFWPTFGLVFFTGVTGAWMARQEGIRALLNLRTELASGRPPTQSLMDGAAVLVGGALLLTPGILTDLVGFLLLFPPTRRAIQRGIQRRLSRAIQEGEIQVRVVSSQPWIPPQDGPSDP